MPSKHPWLHERDGRYYLRAKVPIDLIEAMGRKEIKRSLLTGDLKLARNLIHAEAAKLQKQFNDLRTGPRKPVGLPTVDLEEEARVWFDEQLRKFQREAPVKLDAERRAFLIEDLEQEATSIWAGDPLDISRAEQEAHRLIGRLFTENQRPDDAMIDDLANFLLRARIELLGQRISRLRGDFSKPIQDELFRRPPHSQPIANVMIRDAATSQNERPLLHHMEPWLQFLATRKMRDRQIKQYQRDLREFANSIATTAQMQPPVLQSFYETKMKHLSANTVVRKFSTLRNYWKYLETHKAVPVGLKPFEGLLLPKKRPANPREEWSPQEVCSLWQLARQKQDITLAHAIRIAAFTGGRIESICALSTSAISAGLDGLMVIRFSDKTQAGIRDVPVHSAIQPLIEGLITQAASRKGFLLKIEGSNQFGDRSAGIGKQFGRLKTAQGFGAGRTFHSIRRTMVGLLSSAQCPEAVAADIVGHEKPTMTYGLYRKASDVAEKRRWIEKALVYPDIVFMRGS